jgi:hypothetical protein
VATGAATTPHARRISAEAVPLVVAVLTVR